MKEQTALSERHGFKAVALAAALAGSYGAASAESAEISVFKSPWCGCCAGWVEHVRASGFDVTVTEMDDLQQIKALAGIPAEAQSCHTAMIDGYAVEGHVPAEIISRLLTERPAINGIAVPGMPVGSPGMEGPGARPYEVVTVVGGNVGGTFATVSP